ncbi:hypothetical protein [Arabidopsis thaliana]|jgi:hypothetical protein|uniref:F26K24.18 protein n=2 Tax=Arabidopsis TaxID=3701 RepID=Q9SF10_ARATH|nr:Sterile alpha motif (SAM) domain-containing protein [Arabidopsis thaliana]NP_001326446.1 Sterile alpha motif (SAM) domain-containing protein [Arabidopsis thaliana]NP_974290.1 Sterile alpha motif (SAM) domain-containing protein [Arabidopsis thaliana]KAG7630903.1 Sterile alpha motif domain [Arabidopsis suecica]AAF23205.1 hypothetical protein [Arabidopsis thaliana]AEE75113.1 Sterile alpha motif (SAM) domain-containing protein [Arabidopsis thaliana]ANM64414.1 Sterile alpha motif (SAM) domain-c|eukprot:NP_001326444.1 Sterile alpha motif (SAM) domain-containing protein [Arabidopsis thaliana]
MAKLRPRQLELSKTVPSKLGFDGEEDAWVFVKKQKIFIVLPSLPLPQQQHFTLEKPAISPQLEAGFRESMEVTQDSTFVHTVVPSLPLPETPQSQAELRDALADTHFTTPVPTVVVPALPLPEQFILHKPETSHSQVQFRDCIANTHKTTPLHTVVHSLPVTEHSTLQKPTSSQSQVELRESIADTHGTTPLQTEISSLPLPQHFVLQKPATSQSQADTHETTLLHTILPSLPVPELCTLQKPATSQSQAELRANTRKATLVHAAAMPSLPVPEHYSLQKPSTSQSQAELRAKTRKATLVHAAAIPSLPVPEHYSLLKPSTSQSQAEVRTLTHKATHVHTAMPSLSVTEHCTLQKPATSQSQAETSRVQTVEPEACPDFTSVDKPEIVMSRSLTTRKAPAPKRSLQESRKNQDRRVEIHRRRAGHKPIRFPRVMCSSVVMDNEKLRVLNLEKKVEKAGGLNEWVGSIGLGREFERMLRGQRMSKFQMANLTMEKLKQMGALAVGPRRKLIHAIGCVYHPHCLRASFN